MPDARTRTQLFDLFYHFPSENTRIVGEEGGGQQPLFEIGTFFHSYRMSGPRLFGISTFFHNYRMSGGRLFGIRTFFHSYRIPGHQLFGICTFFYIYRISEPRLFANRPFGHNYRINQRDEADFLRKTDFLAQLPHFCGSRAKNSQSRRIPAVFSAFLR